LLERRREPSSSKIQIDDNEDSNESSYSLEMTSRKGHLRKTRRLLGSDNVERFYRCCSPEGRAKRLVPVLLAGDEGGIAKKKEEKHE
jgi:hypothetical protein